MLFPNDPELANALALHNALSKRARYATPEEVHHRVRSSTITGHGRWKRRLWPRKMTYEGGV